MSNAMPALLAIAMVLLLPISPMLADAPAGEHEEEFVEELGEMVGALTLVLVAATVILGALRRGRPGLLKAHKALGVLALVAGIAHAVIMITH